MLDKEPFNRNGNNVLMKHVLCPLDGRVYNSLKCSYVSDWNLSSTTEE